MYRALAIGGAVAALVASTVSAQAAPQSEPVEGPPGKITIEPETINGSGCPAGTTAVAAAEDNTAFTVTYSQYLAEVGPSSKPTDFRKNCQINLRVSIPQGWTYAISRVDYRGFAHLQAGASGMEKASFYFTGSPHTSSKSHTFRGPYSDNWQASDVTEHSELVWAPCGEKRNLNVNTELRVNAGTSDKENKTSFMTMDSTDSSVSTIYHFSWKQCPAS
ncbi:DUF4360 domain-containing protein [Streptomyces sp. KR80]|uniref:DUF4360 domain-containing protein n=1 Tax=Streptomyces sp. KR80 TaxID=3457426 RepID=UPI003FD3AE5C